ncbi:ubiquitin domain-containing protein [Planoprotostelium fungivorum]|uniref:ubiquitinyl hydrolase 1 n=1 Tax=Planoprotostelium fungivorum TaxID=1890364 RepID=A0A2P6NWC5_9EUKA|nr:ubiquitin domain-containing protein [Planoprotostelium fungivorum]
MVVSSRNKLEETPPRIEDLKREAAAIENSLRNERDVVRLLINIENTLANLEDYPETHCQFFIRNMLMKYITTLLKRTDVPAGVAARIKDFLSHVVSWASKNLDIDEYGNLDIINRITYRAPFYARYDIDADEEASEETMHLDETLNTKPTFFYRGCSRIPKYQDDIIVSFLRARDHIPIIRRLTSSDTPLFIFRICLRVCEHLPLSTRNVVEEMKNNVTTRILNCTDEEFKGEDRRVISDIKATMEEVLPVFFDGATASTWSSNFSLQVAYKYFTSSSLERRLWGLGDIKDAIHDMLKRLPNQDATYAKNSIYEMVQWIREHGIIENLYGSNLHQQLLKRSGDIPRFLSYHDHLENKDIDIIWEASKGHESVTHIVYSQICEFVTDLKQEQSDYLFQKLKTVPFHQYDSHTVTLARILALHLVQIQSNRKPKQCWDGLYLLWDIIQDQSEASPEVQSFSLSWLQNLLQQECCHLQRVPFMELCLSNLSQSQSVPRSLQLLEYIFNSYHVEESRKNGDSVVKTIGWLDSEKGLLDLIFKDLERYKIEAREAALNVPPKDVHHSILSGTQQIKTRLEFLQHLLLRSDLTLSVQRVDLLWSCLVTGAITEVERDYAYQWLENILGMPRIYPPMEQETVEHLFTKKIPEWEFSELSMAGVSFFEYCFRHVNCYNGSFEQKDNGDYVVNSFQLVGIENLWRIALEVKDGYVGKMAATTIIQLYKNLSPSLDKQTAREGFIGTCMKHMSDVCNLGKNKINEKETLVIDRCLLMLKMFLDEYETKLGLGQPCHGNGNRRGSVRKIQVKMPNIVLDFQLLSTDTVGKLRKKLMEQTQSNVRMICAGKELKDDHSLLSEWTRPDGINIIQALSTPSSTANNSYVQKTDNRGKEVDSYSLPSGIMSKPENFDVLFSVLALGGTGAQLSWDLLMLLPTNVHSRSAITNLSLDTPPQWGQLLNASSTYALLYSLQIVVSLLEEREDDSSEDVEAKKEWRERFLSLGGLKYLFSVLLENNFDDAEKGPKRKICLRVLLDIISSFILQHSIEEDTGKRKMEADLETIRTNVSLVSFIHKLMKINKESAANLENRELGTALAVVSSILNTIPDEDTRLSIHCNIIIQSCCAKQPQEIVPIFLQFPDLEAWIVDTLLGSHNDKIRKEVLSTLQQMASPGEGHKQILSVMLSILPKLDHDVPTAEQYFELLQSIIHSDDVQKTTIDYVLLLGQLADSIKAHPIIERRRTKDRDIVLQGLLSTTKTVLRKVPHRKSQLAHEHGHGMFDELFRRCLFDTPTAEDHGPLAPPKCKTATSRRAAYDLLVEITKGSVSIFEHLCDLLYPFHQQVDKWNNWGYIPAAHEKSESGYVGLRNLGATCYMNSLMQQLYMVPQFRYSIMSVPLFDSISEDETQLKENTLYQMQTMLSYLQESERKYYDTRGFVSSYKFDGQPVDPQVQMDADEFFNMIFDRFENLLKPLKKESLLNDYFGGTVCNQIISKECSHVSERDESYFTLSLDVKGKRSIYESLASYVQGELLEGDNKYHCSQCDKKVDAIKRTCIKKLPDNLIIHAKRFEFDLELMRRIKVNDYFEFPHEVNLEPYTLEGLNRREGSSENVSVSTDIDSYKYHLAGILVHTGTADGGHYYSFIREREAADGKERKWYQFNDTDVEQWDPKEIPAACFGGSDTVMQWDNQTARNVPRNFDKMNNAYMLFYERVKTQKISNVRLSPKEEAEKVPQNIYNKIWSENANFLFDKNIFDSDYFTFVWQTIYFAAREQSEKIKSGDVLDMSALQKCIRLAVHFIFSTLIHGKDRSALKTYVDQLIGWFRLDVDSRHWFLDRLIEEGMWLKQGLLCCPHSETRESIVRLVMEIVKMTAEEERPMYAKYAEGLVVMGSDDDTMDIEDKDNNESSKIILLINRLMDMIPHLAGSWQNINEYFSLLLEIAKMGSGERGYLLHAQIISKLVDFYLGDESPAAEGRKRVKMIDKATNTIPQMKNMFSVLALLVRCTSVEGEETEFCEDQPPNRLPHAEFKMRPRDREFITNIKLIEKGVNEGHNHAALKDLCIFLSWECPNTSYEILTVACKRINSGTAENFKPWLDILVTVSKLEDTFQMRRIENLFTNFLNTIRNNIKFIDETTECLKALQTMILQSEVSREWFYHNYRLWVDLLFYPNNANVREIVASMVQHLLPPQNVQLAPLMGQTMSMNTAGFSEESMERVKGVHKILLEYLQKASEACHVDKIPDTPESMNHQRCTQYLRLLRWYSVTTLEKLAVSKNFPHLFEMMTTMNDFNCGHDMQRMEMTLLWLHLFTDCPAAVKQLSRNTRDYKKIFAFYIKLTDQAKVLNEVAGVALYKIINLCGAENPLFFKAWIHHDNFSWAFHLMYLLPHIPSAIPVLHETIEMALQDAEDKLTMVKVLFSPPKHMPLSFAPAMRDVYDKAISTQEDRLRFCQAGYLDAVLSAFQRREMAGRDKSDHINSLNMAAVMSLDLLSWFNDPNPSEEQQETKAMVKKKYVSALIMALLHVIRTNDEELTDVENLLRLLTEEEEMFFQSIINLAQSYGAVRASRWVAGSLLLQRLFQWTIYTMDRFLAHHNSGQQYKPLFLDQACSIATSFMIQVVHSAFYEKAISYLATLAPLNEKAFISGDVFNLMIVLIAERPLHNSSAYEFLKIMLPHYRNSPMWEGTKTEYVVTQFQNNMKQIIETVSSSMDTSSSDIDSTLSELELMLRIHLLLLQSDRVRNLFLEKTGDVFACIVPVLPEEGHLSASIRLLLDQYNKE